MTATSAEDVSDEDVPESVEALDGIASPDEAHNAERPARKALAKKGPPRSRGKPLNEFEVGSTVTGKVRKIADYGAFIDFGAASDGLLHISQLSEGYVASVKDVLEEGQEIQVRIVSIDENKGQVGLSMMSLEQQERAKEAASVRREQRDSTQEQRPQGDRPPRQQQGPRSSGGGPPRRDDSPVVQLLSQKGWDTDQFVDGTVVSIVEFGAFVRFDVSALNPEVQGEIDGLVHISALNAGRVQSVKSVVKVDENVKIRLKNITGNKVSLTMISAEDEKNKAEASGGGGGGSSSSSGPVGSKDWQEDLDRIRSTLPTFVNRPLVVDLRNGSSNGVTMSASAVKILEVAAPETLEIAATHEETTNTIVAESPAPEAVVPTVEIPQVAGPTIPVAQTPAPVAVAESTPIEITAATLEVPQVVEPVALEIPEVAAAQEEPSVGAVAESPVPAAVAESTPVEITAKAVEVAEPATVEIPEAAPQEERSVSAVAESPAESEIVAESAAAPESSESVEEASSEPQES